MSLQSNKSASSTNLLRQFLDSKPTANDGWISYTYGLCPPHPLQRLTNKYYLWEEWANKLPHLYQTGRYVEYFNSQPILSANELKNDDLLRANQILGLCAHATVHFDVQPRTAVVTDISSSSPGAWVSEVKDKVKKPTCPFKGGGGGEFIKDTSDVQTTKTNKKSEDLIPQSILHPWKEVNARLGRPTPTFTYYDYFTMNVVQQRRDEGLGNKNGEEDEYDIKQRRVSFNPNRTPEQTFNDLRCDVKVFGDQSEDVFVLVNHDMEFQSKDLVGLCCDAIDHVIANDDSSLADTLYEIGDVVKRITEAFKNAVPNSRSNQYCDPVSWSKSIGMLIPPIMDDEFSMSGLQSSVVHLLDVFLGRYDYAGELGTLAMEERPWLPSLHQKFFKLLQLSPSVRDYVCQSKSRSLKGYFDRVVRLFGSEQGFLGAHRIKTMGFLELGIKTGRTESSGQTAKAEGPQGWQARVWRKINDDFMLGMEQRLKLQSDSVSEGFTLGLVQSIQELSQGSQSYRITFNVKNSGISYKAGDRLEVLPANTQTIVKRMLLSLCVDASDLSESSMCVKVDKKEWRQESPPLCCFVAISRFYSELADEDMFPLPAVLRIMELRPLNRVMFDAICETSGMKGHAEAEKAFQSGELNDVPDLITLLHNLADENCGALYNLPSKLCSILAPNKPRLYSIANSPQIGTPPTVVTIVVSKLWFEADKVVASSKVTRPSVLRRSSASMMILNDKPSQGGNVAETKIIHSGVATTFLLRDSLFSYVPIRVVEEESFHLPPPKQGKSNPPLLFMALGSGSAPIISFLEELLARDISDCPEEIYFCWGLRSAQNITNEHIISKAVKNIGLKLTISFSGEFKTVDVTGDGNLKVVPGRKERITSTLLRDDWPEILSRLAKHNGHFYLCGHPSLEVSFRAAIESALSCAGKLSAEESSVQFERLTANGRLHSDCFFSGSIYDPNLPSIKISDVAKHSKFNDVWWIYKGAVYNVTEYLNLHPGGAKILYDKAGRDATEDFEIAHGRNNLRVESAMQPYKIGNACKELSRGSFPDRHAFEHAVIFLHSITEIKNVFYLDVNMFNDTGEVNASTHSLAMRFKTVSKFTSSTIPLLISAMNTLCSHLEQQIPRSTMVTLKRIVPSQLSAFLKSLEHILGDIDADGPISRHPSIVTMICGICCDFVSEVHNQGVQWLSSIEDLCNPAVGTFSNLHDICTNALRDFRVCIEVMNSLPSTSSNDQGALLQLQDSLSKRGGRWQYRAPYLDFNACEQVKFVKGQNIIREGDIIASIYVVLSGKVVALENGVIVDRLGFGSVFGAATSLIIDHRRNMTGNELVKESVRVESNECVVYIISPQQILQAQESFRENAVHPEYSEIAKLPHWRQALGYARSLSLIQNARKTNAIRQTNLYPFMNFGTASVVAKESHLISINRGSSFSEEVNGAWVLLEGRVDAIVDEKVVIRYTCLGALFGETASFVDTSNEERIMTRETSAFTFVAAEDCQCVFIPGSVLDTLRTPIMRREAKMKWLKEQLSHHFPSISEAVMISLCHSFHQVKVWPTQNLFEKGESGAAFYIVSSGTLLLSNGEDEAKLLTEGDCAGVEVLSPSRKGGNNSVYSHTCTGKDMATCWMISSSTFLDTYSYEGKTIDIDDSGGNDSDGNASHAFSSGDEES